MSKRKFRYQNEQPDHETSKQRKYNTEETSEPRKYNTEEKCKA